MRREYILWIVAAICVFLGAGLGSILTRAAQTDQMQTEQTYVSEYDVMVNDSCGY